MKIIKREDYLRKLRSLRDQDVIKVVTGVRRCGKSTLLKIFREELIKKGVPERRTQYVNFEDPKYSYGMDWNKVYEMVSSELVEGEMNYIFLDEVQYIEEFERLLIGLQTKGNVDLYVTGSNAHMLSSELATLLSGRSVEISMLPLSFKEYLEVFSDTKLSREELFNNYLSFGGFPQAVSIFERDAELIDDYLASVYETVVGRDIMDRGEVMDKICLNKIVRYLLDNVGSAFSINNIAEELEVSRYKVEQIINALTASFLFYQLNRLDVKGKEILKTQEKYYVVDMGLRWAMLGRDATVDMGHILENIVFLELKRRGGKISIGKADNKEIDFVVKNAEGKTEYYQVAWTVRDEGTLQRELEPFERVKDYNQRFLITMDAEEISHNGVQQVNAVKWLVG